MIQNYVFVRNKIIKSYVIENASIKCSLQAEIKIHNILMILQYKN
jgi:hypothetical protein